MSGTLYLVATPIGNLEDITLRALRVLREQADVIACEDTRQTQKLLQHFQIRKPLVSYHEHNEDERTGQLLQTLERGESVALVSDAGTPLISDPGYRIVTGCVERAIEVIPVPGAAAFVTALCASGLPTDSFRYIGFLPAKSGARRRLLESLTDEQTTVVAYESPHRILEALADVSQVLGTRPVVLARELTKVHEEFLRGTAAQVLQSLSARSSIKGEFTLILGKPSATATITTDPKQLVRNLEKQGFSRMEAIKAAAKQLNLPKREVYRQAFEEADNN